MAAQGLQVGQGVNLNTMNGLVGAHMHVAGVSTELPSGGVGQAEVTLCLIAGCNMRLGIFACFFFGFLAPAAGHDKVNHTAAREVHRHDGVFSQAAALHEQNVEVCGDGQQLAQICLSLLIDGAELFAPVAHLHDAHSTAMPVQHFSGGLGQNLLRHGGGAGRKVERSIHWVFMSIMAVKP